MTELITIPGRWDFEYNYFAGEAASRFFGELKDNRRVMGVRCPRCERVLVPARSFCDRCFQRTEDWTEVGPEGVIETFTILTAAFAGMPKPPVVIAYVTFDGADTALLNVVTGLDLSDVEAAAAQLQSRPRVIATFIDEPHGRITDFTFTLL